MVELKQLLFSLCAYTAPSWDSIFETAVSFIPLFYLRGHLLFELHKKKEKKQL